MDDFEQKARSRLTPAQMREELLNASKKNGVALDASMLHPGVLANGCFTVLIVMTLFFSGVVFAGSFFINLDDNHFANNAISTRALVTKVTEVKTSSHHSNRNRNSGSNSRSELLLEVIFTDQEGNKITTQRAGGFYGTRIGDQIEVFYSPTSPQRIRFSKNSSDAIIWQRIKTISGIIFSISLLLAGLLFFVHRIARFSRSS